MKIGLLSDTHGVLPNDVFEHFGTCDEIWHAGDIGSLEVAEALEKFKPSKMVYGNIDSRPLRTIYPHTHTFTCQGMRICITHIAGKPPSYNKHIQEVIHNFQPNMLVCGHTHMLRIERDKINNMLYVNPGAAGNHGIHFVRTLLRFDIEQGKPKNMEAIEIGLRGS